mgnify:CR=1 FL=1
MNKWLIGSSHVGAVARAHRKADLKDNNLNAVLLGGSRFSKTVFHRIDAGRLEFTKEDYQKNSNSFRKCLDIGEIESIFVLLGDINNLILGNSGFWGSHEPSGINVEGRVPLPQSTIRAFCESDTRSVIGFLTDLQDLGPRPYWVTYPAIKDNHPMFSRGVRRETVHYLDSFFIQHMTKSLAAMGIATVHRPKGSLTENGFLKAEYSQDTTLKGTPDWVHANELYGSLMLNEILGVSAT